MTSTLSSTQVAVASLKSMETADLADIRATTHPDAVNIEAIAEPPACRQPGPAGFHATALWLHNLASDITWEVMTTVAEGDLVVVHAIMRGTQSGEHAIHRPDGEVAQVMPNHGRSFEVTQSHWFRIRDGLVVEHWANRDDIAMGTQLGWFGPPI
jgi:ketosteroid isomerase-like protein